MKIEIHTIIYNEKRFGKPYIGIVDYSRSATRPNVSWGDWIGSPGNAGTLAIDAPVGAILMIGQKDRRGGNSTPEYSLVLPNGELEPLGGDKKTVYDVWKDNQTAFTETEKLQHERADLLARLAEIEKILEGAQ